MRNEIVHVDNEIARNTAAARGAYTSGNDGKAAAYYRRALGRARAMDSAPEIACNAYNLAVCLAADREGRDEALSYLREAQIEFDRAGISAWELPLLEARIARAQSRVGDAVSIARAQLSEGRNLPPEKLIQWHALMAELMCDQSDLEGAAREIASINQRQLKKIRAEIRAEAAAAAARLHSLNENPADAAAGYASAAVLWRAASKYEEMAISLNDAGAAYERVGDKHAAALNYYRSVRSLIESGSAFPFEKALSRGVSLAAELDEAELLRQFRHLEEAAQQKGKTGL